MRCPRCGRENPAGELLCTSCQRHLPRPPAQAYDAMYREQERRYLARRRRDALYALIWGLVTGLGSLGFALWMEANGGNPALIAYGKHTFWLAGLLWGIGAWGLRRVSSSEW
jgi:hypothetical protein